MRVRHPPESLAPVLARSYELARIAFNWMIRGLESKERRTLLSIETILQCIDLD